jgi:hypothetical protein
MLKLATNSEFKEASKNVVQEFQKAGVDLTSKVACLLRDSLPHNLYQDVMEELQSIAKAMVTTPKDLSLCST